MKKSIHFVCLLSFIAFTALGQAYAQELSALTPVDNPVKTARDVKVGAQRTAHYFPLIKNKSVAVVGNHSSLINKTHLVDSLLASRVKVKKVFCPEHGFRGDADAGEELNNYKDAKTGLPVISLYGKNKKPLPEDLKDVDILIYDIQDVGVRFYTYVSVLHYVMEACAENNKQLIVLDRPNPNSYYIDGPVMEEPFKSYVGMHPVPVVYGMTLGEYAQMINGEGWLANGVKCNLKVVSVEGYDHFDLYELPVKPSPNLPNMAAVYLYPSLALFEGTVISVGRGTDKPFQCIGHPDLKTGKYTFTPKSTTGAKNPPYKDQLCRGYDLSEFGNVFIKNNQKLYLYWLQGTYKEIADKTNFFNDYFNKLAGNSVLKQQIMNGLSEEEIRRTWEPELKKFKAMRKKYLLYKDFQ